MLLINLKSRNYLKYSDFFNTKINFSLFLSIFFITSFVVNSFFIFTQDLYKIEADPYKLLGFAFSHLLGLLLLISLPKKLYLNHNLIFCVLLLLLISLRILIDTNFITLIKVCFYKYGIINYFILGYEFFCASRLISINAQKDEVNLFIKLLLFCSFIYSAFLSLKFLGFNIFNSDLKYGFYKETANNTYIIGLVLFSFVSFLDNKKNIFIKNLTILTLFNLAIISFLTGSTMIVIYCAFLSINIIKFKKNKSTPSLITKRSQRFLTFFNLAYLMIFFIIVLYINPNKVDYSIESSILLKNNSRLNLNYLDDNNFFSPITSRFIILNSFFKQFSINPFLGNWQAEIISGSGEGYYMHSILLSSLTHTGVVGFSLMFSIILKSLKKLNIKKKEQGQFLLINFLLVSILGSFFQFLTFMPFWFLLGFVNSEYKKRLIN